MALGTVYRMALQLIPESRLDPDLPLSHCPSHSHSHSNSQSQLAPLHQVHHRALRIRAYLDSSRLAVNPSLKTPRCLPSPPLAESPSRLPPNSKKPIIHRFGADTPALDPSTSKTNPKSPILSLANFLAQCLGTL
jgi:hypothetical protein